MRSRLLTLPTVLAMILAGCTDPDPGADPTPTATVTATATATVTEQPTSPAPTATTAPPTTAPEPTSDDTVALSTACSITSPTPQVEEITFAAPEGWQVGDTCQFFDPASDELEPGTEPDVAVTVRTSDADSATVAAPGEALQEEGRWVGARSGRAAVRIAGVTTGQGLGPAGEERLTYLVDLDAGTDTGGGTLVATARASASVSHEDAASTLDRMMSTVLVRPAAGARVVVTRLEGGGAPVTITREDRCFVLRAGGSDGDEVDRDCIDTAASLEDDILAVVLDETFVAGVAPALAVRVDVGDGPGALTQPAEGGSLFAAPVAAGAEFTARDVDGTAIATTDQVLDGS